MIDADTETNESTNGNNVEPATETLVITHKERSDGTPFVYYVNGVKTRKHDIEFYYANNPAYRGLIEVDYNVGRYYLPDIYNNKSKVVFKNWAATGKTIVTKAAADELGLRIGRKVSLNPALYLVEETVEENIEVDPADYAITSEAMDVAVDAEIELANSKAQTSTPVIDIAEYNTMMTWAEKVSNGQRDAVTPIKTYLSKLGYTADINEIFAYIEMDDLNGFRRFISQFPFRVKDNAGYIQKLYVQEDEQVVLSEIPTSEYPNLNTETQEEYKEPATDVNKAALKEVA